MAHNLDMNGQLTVSVALGGLVLLKARLNNRTELLSSGASRRELRQLRSTAMVELALAWTDSARRKARPAASE
jgi:hypothetical protein